MVFVKYHVKNAKNVLQPFLGINYISEYYL